MGASTHTPHPHRDLNRTMALALGAIGVVFGDIGTSPMYAIAESLHTPGLPADQVAVLGIISLIIWTLFLIVSIKYLLFVTAADNEGEGGIFAIVALLRRRATTGPRFQLGLTVIALASVGLLFADSLITPPLSIMAALEGLESVSPGAKEWVIPGTLVIMLALFLAQRFGTAFLGRLFGPIMLVWFLTLAGLGLVQVMQAPEILTALNPIHALRLIGLLNATQILTLMGSVLLAVTGAEAIYADMGHFGRRPIVLSWYFVALNALLLSYLGQGAWLLHTQSFGPPQVSPFFSIVPKGWEVPMVVLAAAASVIASQAVISGLFSLTRQAIQLGYLPRLRIVQTSGSERGQIYVPLVNTVLAVGCMALAVFFESSSALAGMYGFAVAGTMLLTTLTFTFVVTKVWRWSAWKVLIFSLFALPLDLIFLMATVGKLQDGHYLIALVAGLVVWLLASWLIGNRRLMDRAERLDMPVALFAESLLERTDLSRWPRAGVYFQHLPFPSDQSIAPHMLLREVQLSSTLASPAVVVTLCAADTPMVPASERLSVECHEPGIHSVMLKAGFAERFSVEPLIEHGLQAGWWTDRDQIAWFSSRELLRSGRRHAMPFFIRWPFMLMHRLDQPMADSLMLPTDRYVEVAIITDI